MGEAAPAAGDAARAAPRRCENRNMRSAAAAEGWERRSRRAKGKHMRRRSPNFRRGPPIVVPKNALKIIAP